MRQIFTRKVFARWQASEKLANATLCKAAQEMENDKALQSGVLMEVHCEQDH